LILIVPFIPLSLPNSITPLATGVKVCAFSK
jgi:hypothetical protein